MRRRPRCPDGEVAAELERSAARAQARGGFAAAAAFLERATALTPEESLRSGRALAAAQAKLQVGALDDALRLVATAESGVLSEREQATAVLLRGQISFLATRGSDAASLLLKAAERLRDLDPELARETYLEALTAAIFAGPLAGPGASSREVARSRESGATSPQAARTGPAARRPGGASQRQLRRRRADPASGGARDRGGDVADRAAALDVGGDRLNTSPLGRRRVGAAGRPAPSAGPRDRRARRSPDRPQPPRPDCMSSRASWRLAASLHEAVQEATELTGSPLAPYHAVGLVAMRGREADARRFIDTARAEMTERGEGAGLSFMDWAESVLYNGLGRYAEALAAARRVVDHTELVPVDWAMPELIEAAVRAGAPELAAETDRRLTDRSRASGTDWALGIAARSHALLVDDGRADDLYAEAIERLGRTRVAIDLARAHLLYGEWLRRQRRRLDARKELRIAHEMFTDFGMEAFAERARVELQATGERARKRTVETLDELTPQESQVSRLAAQGDTNREIAAQLFISPSTVEYHLRKAFRKLDVKSRTQLANRLR